MQSARLDSSYWTNIFCTNDWLVGFKLSFFSGTVPSLSTRSCNDIVLSCLFVCFHWNRLLCPFHHVHKEPIYLRQAWCPWVSSKEINSHLDYSGILTAISYQFVSKTYQEELKSLNSACYVTHVIIKMTDETPSGKDINPISDWTPYYHHKEWVRMTYKIP